MFLNSIAEIRDWTDGIAESVPFGEIKTVLRGVERDYLMPLFPKDLLKRLEENADLNTTEKSVRELILEAVAHLAVFKYSFTAPLQLTGSGLQHIETENFKPGFKYEKDDFRNVKEVSGLSVLESALFEAVWNKSELPNYWSTSLHYRNTTARLINFTQDFEEGQYRIGRKTLETMLRFISLVERQTVKPLIGETLYTELRSIQYSDAIFSDENAKKRELLGLLREAMAQYAVALAMEVNMVYVDGAQVITKEWKNDDASSQRSVASINLVELSMRNRINYAKMYFGEVQKFLVNNATDLNYTVPESSGAISTSGQIGIKTLF